MRIIRDCRGYDVSYEDSSIETRTWHTKPRLDGIWTLYFSGVYAHTKAGLIALATFEGRYGEAAFVPARLLVAAITAAAAADEPVFDVDRQIAQITNP